MRPSSSPHSAHSPRTKSIARSTKPPFGLHINIDTPQTNQISKVSENRNGNALIPHFFFRSRVSSPYVTRGRTWDDSTGRHTPCSPITMAITEKQSSPFRAVRRDANDGSLVINISNIQTLYFTRNQPCAAVPRSYN